MMYLIFKNKCVPNLCSEGIYFRNIVCIVCKVKVTYLRLFTLTPEGANSVGKNEIIGYYTKNLRDHVQRIHM